jgi:predicted transcriptional regulator
MSTATFTVRLPEEEKRLISDYARVLGISVSELARQSIMERIEDEVDTRELLEAIREDDGVRYPMEDVMSLVREGG